jgi:polysaccharide biosynthesis transport protein
MVDMNHSLIKHARRELAIAAPEMSLAQRQLTIADLCRTVIKRRFSILGFAALVFATAAAYTFSRVPLYEGVARLQIDPTRSTNLGLDESDKSSSAAPDVDSHVKTEVAIVQSDTVAMRVIDSLELYANPHFVGADLPGARIERWSQLSPSQRKRLLAKFTGNLNVRVVPNTQVVEIRFRSSDPALSTQVANSVIDEYMKRNFLARVDGTAQVSQWLSKQLEEIKSSTSTAQQKLADFKRENNFLGTDESDNIVTDRLKQLNEELTQAEADRIVKEGRYRLARAGRPELIDSTLSNTTVQVLRTQQADLQAQYSQLSAKFGTQYPKLRELQSRLAQLNSAIEAEGGNIETRLANEFDAAARTEGTIRQEFAKQKGEAYKLNQHVSQYAILKHEVESGQHLYDALQLRLKAAGISSGLMSSFVNVIDRADIPDRPVEPRKGLYLALGLGGGLFGGLLLALLLESVDDTVRTSEQLEAMTALPELGTVPFLQALAAKNRNQLRRARPLSLAMPAFDPLVLREPNSPGVESYRALCSLLMLASVEDSPKTLVVTSATSGEGKSTVSCNLAVALAQRGRKVLLIDADLRCSSLHSELGATPGWGTLYAAGATDHPHYQPIAGLPNLHAVPAGIRSEDPGGVLDSPRMQDLMAAGREVYDHIILDTPPVLPFADALVLAARADCVILVARSGVSHQKAVLRARELLARSGANVLGFVLNAVRERESYYRYPSGYDQLSERNHEKLRRQ